MCFTALKALYYTSKSHLYIGPTQRVPGRNVWRCILLWSFCSSCGYAAEKWTQNGTAT